MNSRTVALVALVAMMFIALVSCARHQPVGKETAHISYQHKEPTKQYVIEMEFDDSIFCG